MGDWVRVIPAEGRIVRDPTGRILPSAGAVVNRELAPIYWARRENAGDVTITEAPDPALNAAPAPAPVEE